MTSLVPEKVRPGDRLRATSKEGAAVLRAAYFRYGWRVRLVHVGRGIYEGEVQEPAWYPNYEGWPDVLKRARTLREGTKTRLPRVRYKFETDALLRRLRLLYRDREYRVPCSGGKPGAFLIRNHVTED